MVIDVHHYNCKLILIQRMDSDDGANQLECSPVIDATVGRFGSCKRNYSKFFDQ